MRRAFALALVVMLLFGGTAHAQTSVELDQPEVVAGHSVVLDAPEGVRLEVDGVRYEGPLEVVSTTDGLGLIERTTLDGYLEGIAEVPFAWDMEALRAQAVAARTYLAWTLDRGRSSTGRRYGYDICATTQCQVYAGVGVVEGWGGERWKEAVQSTSDEILLYQGDPAQALYSSTSGGRTRNVEDVFPGARPTPYLEAVPSPGEDSPFVDWTFDLSYSEMSRLLAEAGLLEGDLTRVTTEVTGDGGGSWIVEIDGTEGVRRIGTWELRTELNVAAAVLPDVLPAMRPDVDRRYPQTIMSPTYTIETVLVYNDAVFGPPRIDPSYVFRGHGWGHLVGMSQYGAQAMATSGSTYPGILAHYYGGLRPQVSSGLPEEVVVGLKAGVTEFQVRATGPITVTLDGETLAEEVLGTWSFEHAGDGVRVTAPVGLGKPPRISRLRPIGSPLAPTAVEAWVTTAAEIRVVERAGDQVFPRTPWQVVDAGPVRWSWIEVVPLRSRTGGIVVVQVRSPQGADSAGMAIVPGAE